MRLCVAHPSGYSEEHTVRRARKYDMATWRASTASKDNKGAGGETFAPCTHAITVNVRCTNVFLTVSPYSFTHLTVDRLNPEGITGFLVSAY